MLTALPLCFVSYLYYVLSDENDGPYQRVDQVAIVLADSFAWSPRCWGVFSFCDFLGVRVPGQRFFARRQLQ